MAEAGLIAKFLTLLNKFLQAPPNLAAAGPEDFWYFAEWPHGPLITLALIGLGLSLVQSWRGRAGDQEADQEAQRDWGGTFLGVIFLTSLFVLIFLINEHWQRTRYLVMQAQALFLLLAAHGLQVCLDLVSNFWRKQPLLTGGLALGLSLGLTWPFIQPLSRVMDAGYLGWDRYDLAFEEVAKTWAEAESDSDLGGVKPARLVGTMHPPAAWLYLKQNDYYLVQSSPKLILKPDGSVGDRYTGAALLESAAALDQVLDQEADLWLVIQEFWLFNSYDGLLQQEILWRMDKIWGEGGVWALASRPGTWPLAREMATPLEAEFETGTRLLGFTARPATISPGGVIQLTLFWHGETIPFQKKVFVQVRNAANETVSQADHFIYDGKVPSSRWDDLLENDWAIRDGATLVLPPDLPPGEYRIIVGFYDSQTFARLGVINDQSGESGVVLGTWMVE